MSEIKVISCAEFAEAKHALPKIQALVVALKDIDRRTVGGNVDAFASIQDFKSKIIPIFENYKELVEKGDVQYRERDQGLVNKAASRMFEIPSAIGLLESNFKHKIRAYQHKENVLQQEGFTEPERAKLNPPITDSDRKELDSEIKVLRDEETALLAYLGDSPCFNTELLKNTSVYPKNSEAD